MVCPGAVQIPGPSWGREYCQCKRSGSNDHADPRRGRQQWEVDVESDLQGFGNGRELADGGVAPAALERGDHRLGDLHAIGELQLREPHLLAGSTYALSDELRVYGRAAGARHDRSVALARLLGGEGRSPCPAY